MWQIGDFLFFFGPETQITPHSSVVVKTSPARPESFKGPPDAELWKSFFLIVSVCLAITYTVTYVASCTFVQTECY